MRGKLYDHHQSLSPCAGSQQIDDVLVLAKVDQNLEFWGQFLVLCFSSALWKGKGKLKQLGEKVIGQRTVLLVSNQKWKFENRSFTLKSHQPFSVHTTADESPVILHLCWNKTRTRKYRDYHILIFFVFKMFSFHLKTQSRHFQIPPVWRTFTKSSHFRDGVVWTKGLTEERKEDSFSNSSVLMWTPRGLVVGALYLLHGRPEFKSYSMRPHGFVLDGPRFNSSALWIRALCYNWIWNGSAVLPAWLSREFRLWNGFDSDAETFMCRTYCINYYSVFYKQFRVLGFLQAVLVQTELSSASESTGVLLLIWVGPNSN